MNVSQLIAPTAVAPVNARKVTPSKLGKKNEPTKLAKQIEELRAQLTALTGAPCSPVMGVESLIKAIEKAKTPVPELSAAEIAQQLDEAVAEFIKPIVKTKNKPSKPVGITKYIVQELKAGVNAKDVLVGVHATFPTANTTLACVYWCASKIKSGAM